MAESIQLDAARDTMLSAVATLPAEQISLAAGLGRVAAEDVIAEADLVPYARSAMDGYALRAADARGATPVRLPVVGKALAEPGDAVLSKGAAMAITTGAPLPRGADAVIPYEQVERVGEEIVISAAPEAGSYIFPPAEDVRRGDVLVRRGAVLRPATLALLAFVGRAQVQVFRRPCASVVCTGSELVEVSAVPSRGQIRNSNRFTLTALITECGAEARYCGTAVDDREALARRLTEARRDCDLLITTGGASVGERDFVKAALEELGVEFKFRGVAMRPGKPIGFGIWKNLPVCVLPGNPAAAFVCFYEFVRPALLRMGGRNVLTLPTVLAQLRGRVKSKAGGRHVILARVARNGARFDVTPLENQCSVLVRTLAETNALIVLPEGPASFEAGETVEVQVLDWESSMRTGPVPSERPGALWRNA